LGLFHKGTEFIIYSDITNDAKHDRRKEFDPGFFREVAVCYSLGYRCKRKEDN